MEQQAWVFTVLAVVATAALLWRQYTKTQNYQVRGLKNKMVSKLKLLPGVNTQGMSLDVMPNKDEEGRFQLNLDNVSANNQRAKQRVTSRLKTLLEDYIAVVKVNTRWVIRRPEVRHQGGRTWQICLPCLVPASKQQLRKSRLVLKGRTQARIVAARAAAEQAQANLERAQSAYQQAMAEAAASLPADTRGAGAPASGHRSKARRNGPARMRQAPRGGGSGSKMKKKSKKQRTVDRNAKLNQRQAAARQAAERAHQEALAALRAREAELEEQEQALGRLNEQLGDAQAGDEAIVSEANSQTDRDSASSDGTDLLRAAASAHLEEPEEQPHALGDPLIADLLSEARSAVSSAGSVASATSVGSGSSALLWAATHAHHDSFANGDLSPITQAVVDDAAQRAINQALAVQEDHVAALQRIWSQRSQPVARLEASGSKAGTAEFKSEIIIRESLKKLN